MQDIATFYPNSITGGLTASRMRGRLHADIGLVEHELAEARRHAAAMSSKMSSASDTLQLRGTPLKQHEQDDLRRLLREAPGGRLSLKDLTTKLKQAGWKGIEKRLRWADYAKVVRRYKQGRLTFFRLQPAK